ncbi:MAG: hypothetical protein JWO96_258 [Candidatus Saccharibacteria bacterium]|nr:hypothetical protein [Candidatus Saccharibacteria bacterium]
MEGGVYTYGNELEVDTGDERALDRYGEELEAFYRGEAENPPILGDLEARLHPIAEHIQKILIFKYEGVAW